MHKINFLGYGVAMFVIIVARFYSPKNLHFSLLTSVTTKTNYYRYIPGKVVWKKIWTAPGSWFL